MLVQRARWRPVIPLFALLLATPSILAAPLVFAAASATTRQPLLAPINGSYVFHLTFDGLRRDYRIHVPPAAASGQPLPLVLNLAGATQNGQIQEILSDMDANAD